jgi:hypothetical protein
MLHALAFSVFFGFLAKGSPPGEVDGMETLQLGCESFSLATLAPTGAVK